MVQFLSAEWFAEINAADVSIEPNLCLTLEQRITGGAGGDVRYRITVAEGRLHAALVDPLDGGPLPDAIVSMDMATAVALATATVTAHDVFLAGAVRLSGDVRMVASAGGALAAIGEALAPIAGRTSY